MSGLMIALVVFALVIFLWFIGESNRLNRYQVMIEESKRTVDITLVKRYETISEMLNAAKAYAKHEEKVFSELVALRQGASIQESNQVIANQNDVLATSTALRLADYVVTEAGFGADLGAEKFLDIKTPNLPASPSAVVIVATIRALKMNGGVAKDALSEENVEAVRSGFSNLERHVENMRKFGVPVAVAINEFVTDTEAEIATLKELCASIQVPVELASVWADGADGGVALAETVVATLETSPASYTRLYDNDLSIEEKITKIAKEIYRADNVVFEKKAKTQIAQIVKNGWDKLPVCMAKTQYSFSDDPSLLGAPSGFDITIRELVPKTGAGFVVALTGEVMTMPGLPKRPAALNMDVAEDGTALGLF